MFDIEYKGGNCVVISTKKTTLTVDSNLSVVGLKELKYKDAVELATESRLSTASSDVRMVIESPGDYEVGDFTIHGVAAQRHIDSDEDEKRSTMYRIECGDIKIAVIGNIDPKISDEQLEGIGLIDILIIPVGGGGYTLDATSAAAIVRHIEPKGVIPVHYMDASLRYEVPQDNLETFVKELGAPVEEVAGKLKIKASSALPTVLTILKLPRS